MNEPISVGLAHHFKLDLEKYQNISLYSIWNSMISQSKDATSRASAMQGLDTNNEAANTVVLSLSRCQSCGQMWMSVRICWRGWAPGRCVQKDHPPLLQEPKALLRFESWPRDFWSGILWALWIWVVFFVLIFYIQLPCSFLADLQATFSSHVFPPWEIEFPVTSLCWFCLGVNQIMAREIGVSRI